VGGGGKGRSTAGPRLRQVQRNQTYIKTTRHISDEPDIYQRNETYIRTYIRIARCVQNRPALSGVALLFVEWVNHPAQKAALPIEPAYPGAT